MAARRAEILAAAASAPAAFWWFAQRPPGRVLVGTTAVELHVPAHYQASAFPPFVALVAALAVDVFELRERSSWAARIALLLATSTVAALRLAGALPLSGHAVLFAAVLAYELLPPRPPGARIAAMAAAPGLALTAWYKVVVWNDGAWFLASLAAGTAIGAACGRAAGRARR